MDAINNKSVVEAALRNLENKIENLILVKNDIKKKILENVLNANPTFM